MRWFDRFTTLVKADAHGVLEQLEERSLLAKQHLREAELELTRKRARDEALEEQLRRIADEVQRLEAELQALDEDVELALAGGKDELARFALRRLLPKRRSLTSLRQRSAELVEERSRLSAKLASQERELEELERQVRARLAADAEPVRGEALPETPAADEEIELELLRRARARGHATEAG
jgi:phage shock protein A